MRSTNALRGISGGMIQIVHGLEVLVRALGVEPRFGHTLTGVEAIDAGGPRRMRLHFADGASVDARHVVLAMPQRPLQALTLTPQNPVADDLDSVIGIGLLKLFFVIDQPWWEDHRPANRYANDLPCRELHYWKSRDRTKGFMMLYTDRPALHFWADYELGSAADLELPQDRAVRWFLKHERARTELDTGNPRLWRRFVQYARDYEHNDFTVDRLLACGLRDWSRAPYGAAVHVWRPRRESWNVMKSLTAFSLDGGPPAVHVCTDAYSDHQGFIEGALRSTARVLTYFSTGGAADRFSARTFLEQWALGDSQ
jgi:monoamine oxidase